MFKKTRFYRELRYWNRAWRIYGRGWEYIYKRFKIAPRILQKENLDNPASSNDYSVHVFCSHKDILFLSWSLASWYKAVPNSGQVFVHEDGSFTDSDRKLIARLFPHTKFLNHREMTEQALSIWLRDLPAARKLRGDRKYFFMAKLVDSRFVSMAPARLLFDTDVLWFKEPTLMLSKLAVGESFMMSGREVMDFELSNSSLPKSVANMNAGIIGYSVKNYSEEQLEDFCTRVGLQSNPYFIEQAGHAYILSSSMRALPENEYQIKGPATGQTVAKHYTGPRREQFWFEGVALLNQKIL